MNPYASIPTAHASQFLATDKMRTLVFSGPHLLPVLSRFGIALGFGESTVEDVCSRHNVDVDTFLTVCNYISGRSAYPRDVELRSLVKYLKNAHEYFMEYVLPEIRKKIIEAISNHGEGADITRLFVRFYDEYVDEVRRHLAYEEEKVFVYVLNLCANIPAAGYSIGEFVENHRPIAEKLRDIKELFIAHYTADHARVDLFNTVLFDLMICERDLLMHCALEDNIFVPAVQILENSIKNHYADQSIAGAATGSPASSHKTAHIPDSSLTDKGDVMLTARERDIVRAIAQGLSNKEIADRLFLSIHTVTTHRRNISSKLNIHSPSGLTIYALMHGIITLSECSVSS